MTPKSKALATLLSHDSVSADASSRARIERLSQAPYFFSMRPSMRRYVNRRPPTRRYATMRPFTRRYVTMRPCAMLLSHDSVSADAASRARIERLSQV